jgi:phosphomethylpyrimidine synthase
MVEGPGHVPLNMVRAQILGIKAACGGAPLYVLGPLVSDVCPGYDHIAGAIGGALAVEAGADFLCYLTPAEHLTLPDRDDVRAGVTASRIAAQAGERALGRPHALKRELAMSEARKKLDWKLMQESALDPVAVCAKRAEHADEEVCAMCGGFCAVTMLRE